MNKRQIKRQIAMDEYDVFLAWLLVNPCSVIIHTETMPTLFLYKNNQCFAVRQLAIWKKTHFSWKKPLLLPLTLVSSGIIQVV